MTNRQMENWANKMARHSRLVTQTEADVLLARAEYLEGQAACAALSGDEDEFERLMDKAAEYHNRAAALRGVQADVKTGSIPGFDPLTGDFI